MPAGHTHLKKLKLVTNSNNDYIQVQYIKVDGKYIIDSNQTVTDVPTITSTYRANPTAGFSIIDFISQSASSYTVAHGLNSPPHFIIFKDREEQGQPWTVYHRSIGTPKYILLNGNGAEQTYSFSGDPTSSVFYLASGFFVEGNNIIAYCWSEVDGYSSFGSYTGNGDTNGDGPFVYCGFKPRFIIFKRTNSIGHWMMYDTKRDDYNEMDKSLSPNQDTNETSISSNDEIDVVSNGFKHRSNHNTLNTLDATYIYAAFAEHPFKYSRAR